MNNEKIKILQPSLNKIQGKYKALKSYFPPKKKKKSNNLLAYLTKDEPDVFDRGKSVPDLFKRLNKVLSSKNFSSSIKESIGGSMLPIIVMAASIPIFIQVLVRLFSPRPDDMQFSGEVSKDFASVVRSVESQKEGYNASYNQWAEGEDLSKLTVKEVLEKQKDALRNNEKTKISGSDKRSSAIGLYQITSETLEDMVDKNVVDEDEMFTPEVQDKLGWYLLNRAGFAKFVRNEISAEEFIKNLKATWEGFENIPDSELKSIVERLKAEQLKSIQQHSTPEAIKPFTTNQISDEEAEKYLKFTERTGSKENYKRLQPAIRTKINQLAKYYYSKYNEKLTIESAARSIGENINVGGSPTSRHIHGLAVDIPQKQVMRLKDVLGHFGLESLGIKQNWEEEIHHIQLRDNSQASVNRKPILNTLENYSFDDPYLLEEQLFASTKPPTTTTTTMIIKKDVEINSINEVYYGPQPFPLSTTIKAS